MFILIRSWAMQTLLQIQQDAQVPGLVPSHGGFPEPITSPSTPASAFPAGGTANPQQELLQQMIWLLARGGISQVQTSEI